MPRNAWGAPVSWPVRLSILWLHQFWHYLDENPSSFYPSHRDAAFDCLISSIWDDPQDDEVNLAWTRETFATMAPFSGDSVYVNYLGNEGRDPVRDAYKLMKDERLVDLKNRYDPTNLFRMNQNIQPTVARTTSVPKV